MTKKTERKKKEIIIHSGDIVKLILISMMVAILTTTIMHLAITKVVIDDIKVIHDADIELTQAESYITGYKDAVYDLTVRSDLIVESIKRKENK